MVISTPSDSAYNSTAFMSYPSTASSAQPPSHHHSFQPHPHNQSLEHPHLYHPAPSHNGVVSASNANTRKYPQDTSSSTTIDWDINDTHVPHISPGEFNEFDEWVDGHQRCVYPANSEEARKHTSGWAMRNTNNHNVNILKKSCLGVLVCSMGCRTATGDSVHLRPAICDKARRKQQGKVCPNRSCKGGRLEVRPCRGHCGYPVTHFWRHVPGGVFFQSKGVHDHLRPDAKNSAETRRALGIGRKKRGTNSVVPVVKCEITRNVLTAKNKKKTCVVGGLPLQRPPPLIPDTNTDFYPTTCSRCLLRNCSCRTPVVVEPTFPTFRSHQEHNCSSHKPMQSCDHPVDASSIPQSQHYWPHTGTASGRSQDFYQTETDQHHVPTGNPSLCSGNTHMYMGTQETNQSSHSFVPISNDLFEPNHIFQLDQPLLRRMSSGAAPRVAQHSSQLHLQTAQSPPTLLDLGSGAIEHKAFESFFEANEDSCTTSSSQNNEGPECVYTQTGAPFHSNHLIIDQQASMVGSYGHCADRTRASVAVGGAFNCPITESDDILLEFESANDRLQGRKNECLMVAGEMNRSGRGPIGSDLTLQGNLGIFLERDEGGYGSRAYDPNSYNHQAGYSSGGAHDQCIGHQNYSQYYRINSNNSNGNNNNNIIYHNNNNNNSVGREYVLEPGDVFGNRS